MPIIGHEHVRFDMTITRHEHTMIIEQERLISVVASVDDYNVIAALGGCHRWRFIEKTQFLMKKFCLVEAGEAGLIRAFILRSLFAHLFFIEKNCRSLKRLTVR